MAIVFNKLVRDKIPEIIEKNGDTAKIHIASDEEFAHKLSEKLLEEVEEFREDHDLTELAD